MKLSHFTGDENLKLSAGKFTQSIEIQKLDTKPFGLWVTDMDCEDNWKSWCEQEDFCIDRLRFEFRLEVDLERILLIDTIEKLITFSKTNCTKSWDIFGCFVDWKLIYASYSGILITPYFPQARHLIWYSGWDCASGAIWDISCIKSIERAENHDNHRLEQSSESC